jgi:hypothetical protein
MRRLIPTRALTVFLLPLLAWGCADADWTELHTDLDGVSPSDDSAALDDEASEPGGSVPPDSIECRAILASGSVSGRAAGGDRECEFDTAASRFDCVMTGSDVLTREDYASAADFVEAGQHIGKVTSLASLQRENGRDRRTQNFFDELGRLTHSVESNPAGDVTHRYRDYDDVGRPRRESVTGGAGRRSDCGSVLVRIAYDDVLGTVSRTLSGDAGCGSPVTRALESYDAAGNLLRVDTDEGDGLRALWQVTPSARSIVCP